MTTGDLMSERMKRIRLLGTLVMALVLGACSTTHVIEVDFPAPLVASLPISAQGVFTPGFVTYRFEQTEEDRGDMTVVLGEAQTRLFRTIFDALFDEYGEAEIVNPELSLQPELLAFQYALPKETGSDFYEVWLKYRVQVRSGDQQIADWQFSGYGRAANETMQTQGAGVNGAAEEALRDIGTQLAIGFAQQPDIQAWLRERDQ